MPGSGSPSGWARRNSVLALLLALVLAGCHAEKPVAIAAPDSKAGYLWAYLPSAVSYVVSGPHAYNSSGGSIAVTRSGAGLYSIVFAGLADQGGVAHVEATGPESNFCMVLRWIPDGPDEVVSISCYTSGTDPTDTFFTANFAAGNQPGAVYSYLWADQPTSTGRYTPSRQYRHDSTGQDSWIARESTGRYRVYLPAAAVAGTGSVVYQVTAYGAATFQCKVSATSVPGATLEVSCRDVLGTLFDTRFALSFSAVGSLFGRTDRRTGTAAAVTRQGAGVYRAVVPGLGQDRGQVVVNATGAGPTWCHADRWDPTGPDLAVLVRCYGPRGAAVDSAFSLGLSW